MRLLDWVLRFFLTAVTVLVFIEVVVEVVLRYTNLYFLPWGAELSQTLLVWLTFVGAAAAFLRGEHIGIEMFVDRLPPAVRAILRRVNLVLILIFLVYASRSGLKVVERTWEDVTASLQISAGILYLALPVGCALMIVFALWMFCTGKEKLS